MNDLEPIDDKISQLVRCIDREIPRDLEAKIQWCAARAERGSPRPFFMSPLGLSLAGGTVMLLLVAAASFWLLRGVQTQNIPVDLLRHADRFEISYIKVGGAPAQAIIYQPQGSNMIVVWAEKNL